jgi:protein CpxP
MTKRIVLTALMGAALFGASLPMRAADEKPKSSENQGAGRQNRPNVEERVNNFAKEANLSDEQKQKLKGILEQEQGKMRDLRQDTSSSREDRRSKTQDIRKDTDAKVKALLNADQYAKWEKMRSEGGGQRRRRQKE